jgi:thioredoxin 1
MVLAPVLESISEENALVTYAKVDVDALPELAKRFQVASLPTVAAFQNGLFKDKFLGVRDRKFIETFTQAAFK